MALTTPAMFIDPRFCGRYLSTDTVLLDNMSVCSKLLYYSYSQPARALNFYVYYSNNLVLFGVSFALSLSLPAKVKPFRVRFVTDSGDISVTTMAMASMSETNDIPGGIIGFSLDWNLIKC